MPITTNFQARMNEKDTKELMLFGEILFKTNAIQKNTPYEITKYMLKATIAALHKDPANYAAVKAVLAEAIKDGENKETTGPVRAL